LAAGREPNEDGSRLIWIMQLNPAVGDCSSHREAAQEPVMSQPRGRRTSTIAVLAALSAFTASPQAGPAFAADPPPQRLTAEGRRILADKCAQCHAIDAEGVSPMPAAPPFRSLHRKYPIGHLAEALAEGITTGHEAMPEFVFSTTEITAILAYIDSIADGAPSR
jgi:mono/diheme cytochrome c family protein